MSNMYICMYVCLTVFVYVCMYVCRSSMYLCVYKQFIEDLSLTFSIFLSTKTQQMMSLATIVTKNK